MTQRRPKSPLFPTRRSSDLPRKIPSRQSTGGTPRSAVRPPSSGQTSRARSEEHTSELQSRGHLVCRLLLEKKKRKTKINIKNTTKIRIKKYNFKLKM